MKIAWKQKIEKPNCLSYLWKYVIISTSKIGAFRQIWGITSDICIMHHKWLSFHTVILEKCYVLLIKFTKLLKRNNTVMYQLLTNVCWLEVISVITASAALALSDIPWNGPVGMFHLYAREGIAVPCFICISNTHSSSNIPKSTDLLYIRTSLYSETCHQWHSCCQVKKSRWWQKSLKKFWDCLSI